MVDQIIRPSDLPRRSTPVATEIVPVDNDVSVAGSTLKEIAEAGRPTASEAEALAGTEPFKAMTPLTTKQAIDGQVSPKIDAAISALNLGTAAQSNVGDFATASQGMLADTAVQPSILVNAGTGLSGGGSLASDRTISLSSSSISSLSKADTAVQPSALGDLAALNTVDNTVWSGVPLAPSNGGFPPGGSAGQVPVKATDSNFDITWETIAAATSVSYAPQSLTSLQQSQARENISAPSTMDIQPNLSVNGSLIDCQENGDTLGTTNGYFYADQHAMYRSADLAGKVSVQRVAYTSLAGSPFAGEFKCVSVATLISTSLLTDSEPIEGSRPEFVAAGWGASGAKPFMYRKEINGRPAGTYYFHFQNSAGNRHCWVPYTITAAEAGQRVVKEVVVPGDTSGTWLKGDGTIGVLVDDVMCMGSSFVGGTAGTWGSSAHYGGATVNFLTNTANVSRHTDFGLRLDPDATGVYGRYAVGEVDPVYRSERYGELILPNGFYSIISSPTGTAAQSVSSVRFRTLKAKTPSASFLGGGSWDAGGLTPLVYLARDGVVWFSASGAFYTNSTVFVHARLSA